MGRYKSVEIESLFIEDFKEIFNESFTDSIKQQKLSEKEIREKLAPKLDDIISEYENTISSLYVEHHKFNLDSFLKIHFKNQKTIAETNKESFIPFFVYINSCVVVYNKIVEKISGKRIDSTLKMNVALFGLVTRRAQEIGDLLLSGYIDAAMIIWRSLYENSIILLLLALENDPTLADKFYRHSIRNSKKKVTSYDKHFKELKFKPLPKSTHKKLQDSTENLNNIFGKDFLDNEYGWADSLFPGKQKASLRLLEERVEMSAYRPYYLLCCEQIHPNFSSFKRYMEGNKIILPRLMNQDVDLKSFIDPMQFTLRILHDVNDYILYEFSTPGEYDVNVLLMTKIYEKQQSSFDKKKIKGSS